MVSWPDSWKPSTAVNSKVHRYGRPGREPRGPGVPDASSHVLGVGQPTLYLERLEQVCSPSLLVQMSILAEHREKSGLGLQNVALSSYRVSTLLAPPHPQGRGTKATPLPGFRGSQIGFQVCQENTQGLELPTRTEQEDPAVWYLSGNSGTLFYLQAWAGAPNEASTLYDPDPGPVLSGKAMHISEPLVARATHCHSPPLSSDTSRARILVLTGCRPEPSPKTQNFKEPQIGKQGSQKMGTQTAGGGRGGTGTG